MEVKVMVLDIEPRDREPKRNGSHDHIPSESNIRVLLVLQEVKESGNIMGHLGSRSRGAVVVLEHAVM
jgi:hypothetical protein